MPIKVQCACGAAFAAKDELAGRTVKCPKCQQPLKIPVLGAVPAVAAPRSGLVPAQPPRQLAAPLPSQGASDLFAEAGLHTQQAGTVPCPGCAAPMPMNAVVCIKCGYNKKIGRRMETVSAISGPVLPGGHTVTADELLARAARTIEEDKEEERKKTREGMPWWIYGIGILCVVGFMITMMVLPQRTALLVGGSMMWVATLLIMIYAEVRLAIIAFAEGIGQGVMFLICGPYQLFFIFTHWDQCGGYVLMSIGANVMNGIVQFAMEMTLGGEEEEAYRLDPLPAAVAKTDFDWQPIPLRKA